MAFDAISVMDRGAAGDGSADDTDAIQSALDCGQNVYFPPGNYLVERTLFVRSPARRMIFGPGGMREGTASMGDRIARIFTPMEWGVLFRVETHMTTFSGLHMEGPGRKNDDHPKRHVIAVDFEKRANTDDVDGRVLECVFTKFPLCVRVVGRGLRAERSVFAGSNEGIRLEWPGSGVERSKEDDPFGLQDMPYGMRAFAIVNNRVHACSTFLVNEGSRSEHRLWGLLLANNLADVGDGLFRGGATYSAITNNVVCHANKTILAFTGACHHTTITGNVLSGHRELPQQQPSHGIHFSNNCHDVSITANTFANTRNDGIVFEVVDRENGERQEYVAIQGNTFEQIGSDEGGAKGILFRAPAKHFAICGNTFKLGGRKRCAIGAQGHTVHGFEVVGNAYRRDGPIMCDYQDGSHNTIQS